MTSTEFNSKGFRIEESVSLKEYLISLVENNDKRYEQRFHDTKIAVDAALIAADKAVAAALAGQKEAVTKAEVAAEKRFESVNEFRNALSDQQITLLPRSEAGVKFGNLEKNIDILSKEISELRESRASGSGKSYGMEKMYGWIFAGIMGIISIASIIFAVTKS